MAGKPMPLAADLPPVSPPAIIQRAPLVEVRFGLSTAPSRVAYDQFALPRDWRGATLSELLAWIPRDLRHMPPWALQAMFVLTHRAGFGAGGSGVSLIKTTTFLTSTGVGDQTWTVLSDWNSADNTLNVISAGANGTHGDGGVDGGGDGGGGGGFAKAVNQTLTASGSSKFRLRAGNAGTGTANACWIGGSGTTTLATSLCGIQSAGGRTGGSTTSGIGSTKNPGGTGGAGGSAVCCGPGGGSGGGGGAAGPNGGGNNGTDGGSPGFGSPGGSGDAGAGGSNGNPAGNGTEFNAIKGSGGGGDGNRDADAGNGGLYGGGGGGVGGVGNAGSGQQALIVTINNASL